MKEVPRASSSSRRSGRHGGARRERLGCGVVMARRRRRSPSVRARRRRVRRRTAPRDRRRWLRGLAGASARLGHGELRRLPPDLWPGHHHRHVQRLRRHARPSRLGRRRQGRHGRRGRVDRNDGMERRRRALRRVRPRRSPGCLAGGGLRRPARLAPAARGVAGALARGSLGPADHGGKPIACACSTCACSACACACAGTCAAAVVAALERFGNAGACGGAGVSGRLRSTARAGRRWSSGARLGAGCRVRGANPGHGRHGGRRGPQSRVGEAGASHRPGRGDCRVDGGGVAAVRRPERSSSRGDPDGGARRTSSRRDRARRPAG